MSAARRWVLWLVAAVSTALLTAWLDGLPPLFGGLPGYLALALVCGLILKLAWEQLSAERIGRGLAVAVFGGLALRLLFAAGMQAALPRYGYDEKPQRAGYLYYDAFRRDRDAWDLARSDVPLSSLFADPQATDQYGGLQFLSAALYRFLSPDEQHPLMIVLLTATASALMILFTWAFAADAFGARAGMIAAWIAALYPDAIMLGASQMREPFLLAVAAAAFYGYMLLRGGRRAAGLALILVPLALIGVPISPPTSVGILLAIMAAWVWEGRMGARRSIGVLLALGVVAIAALALVVRSWSGIGDLLGSGVEVLIGWWRSAGAQWQQNMLADESVWIRRAFMATPDWANIPLVVLYGLLRPFFASSLLAGGAPLWQGIAIWRGLGWLLLLTALIYAPFAALKRTGVRSLASYLSFLVWGAALVASYRGAGDQWDNPRYRTVFLTAQAALAAWAYVHARDERGVWLGRLYVLMGVSTALFAAWYAVRKRLPPSFSVLHALALIGGLTAIVFLSWVVKDTLSRRKVRA